MAEDKNDVEQELPDDEAEGTEGNEDSDAGSQLGMSDEEFLKQAPPVGTPLVPAAEPDAEADDGDADAATGTDDTDADGAESAPAKPEAAKAPVKAAEPKKESKGPQDPKLKADPHQDAPSKPAVTATKVEEQKKPADTAGEIDYKAAYERLLAPFKANGKDVTVSSVDDAISLMQMGANYQKKMAALKPHLKHMKALENNGLLTEDHINYLIDLGKKNPAAIAKLVKESGIDPMEIDVEKAGEYKQSTYTVDDREIELDTVLDEISGTPSYNRMLDVVSNKWDVASKQAIAGNPQLLKVINDHIDRGIYDLITKKIESEKVFGRLNGLSDLDAYRQVGDAIQAAGGFNHLVQASATPGVTESPKQPIVVTRKPKVEDDKLNDKRRAAGSTKPTAQSPGVPAGFNPLAMSDEEFKKVANTIYR